MLSGVLKGQAGQGFQARAERAITVLINAALLQGDRDGLCRIRNMSETGIMIETALALTVDEPVIITLHSGRTFEGVPRWSSEGRIGLSCAVDPTEILTEEMRAVAEESNAPALPRFERAMKLKIVAHGLIHHGQLDSISTKDVIVTGAPTNLDASQVTICLPRLSDQTATIIASEDGNIFARFSTPIPFAELNQWLVR